MKPKFSVPTKPKVHDLNSTHTDLDTYTIQSQLLSPDDGYGPPQGEQDGMSVPLHPVSTAPH